jgi:hypothetical protein
MSDGLMLKNPNSSSPAKMKIMKWVSDFSTLKNILLKDESTYATYLNGSVEVVPFESKWQQFQIKRQLNEEKIISYSKLSENWNDNGATAISKDVVEKALNLLHIIMIDFQPEIFPTARNSIQFEYEDDDNYLEIEVFKDSYILYKNYNDIEKESKVYDLNTIDEEITAYYASINRK